MEKPYNAFFDNLTKRFTKSDISEISEDCIRYDYFISLLPYVDSSDIILEYPHPINKKK